MSLGLTWRVGFLVALPAAAAALAVGTFAGFMRSVSDQLPTVNVAGGQRMRAAELTSWARMVAEGQESDRPGLELRIAAFDAALLALRTGGRFEQHQVAPVPAALEPALAELEHGWRDGFRPRFLAVARGRPGAPETVEAVAWLASSGDGLRQAADGYVGALETHARDGLQEQAFLLAAIAGLDGALFLLALWLTRRHVVLPLRALTEAARRAQRGDFSRPPGLQAQGELGVLAVAFEEAAAEVGRLLAEEARYHDVIEHLGDAVVMAAQDGKITYANTAAERMLGRSRTELIGSSLDRLVPEQHRAAHQAAFARAAQEGGGTSTRTVQAEALRADGSVVPADISVSAHRVAGELLFTGVLRDVSERVQLTARMMQMDRMIAVGTLAAGVAHEINNPLAYVVANLGYLADELPRLAQDCRDCRAGTAAPAGANAVVLADLTEVVEEAREGAERVRTIVRDLKSFSRSADEQRSRVQVQRILESSINMAWNEIRHRARLTKELGDVPPVDANESRLGQVYLNLLINAAQAIPEGHAEANEIRVSARQEGSSVVVEIRDSGGGILPENLPRIFDPFFTTKPVGQGTGLGLSICQGIVNGLGGSLTVTSVLGAGTTFRVTLPAAPKLDGNLDGPLPARAEQAGRRGRVLIVDDEPAICSALLRILGPEHDVACAQNGNVALALLEGGAAFDVILCDLMMPEMSGMELHEALARNVPGAERLLVFLSGGVFTPNARSFLDRVPNLRVEKPFEPQAVRALVRERVA